MTADRSGDADHGAALRLRPAAARGRLDADGIAAVEAFSRGDAIDRAWMGWGALRVLSRQDWMPGASRDEGRVANMDRLLLVLDGTLDAGLGVLGRHRAVPGEALWLECGHGVEVRLANASARDPMRLLECWLQPRRVNAPPAVARIAAGSGDGTPGPEAQAWRALDPVRGSVRIAAIEAGTPLDLPAIDHGRCWLEVIAGEVGFDPRGRLGPGDGMAWQGGEPEAPVRLRGEGPGRPRVLLVTLPA